MANLQLGFLRYQCVLSDVVLEVVGCEQECCEIIQSETCIMRTANERRLRGNSLTQFEPIHSVLQHGEMYTEQDQTRF